MSMFKLNALINSLFVCVSCHMSCCICCILKLIGNVKCELDFLNCHSIRQLTAMKCGRRRPIEYLAISVVS